MMMISASICIHTTVEKVVQLSAKASANAVPADSKAFPPTLTHSSSIRPAAMMRPAKKIVKAKKTMQLNVKRN